jgi:hypothetical protein
VALPCSNDDLALALVGSGSPFEDFRHQPPTAQALVTVQAALAYTGRGLASRGCHLFLLQIQLQFFPGQVGEDVCQYLFKGLVIAIVQPAFVGKVTEMAGGIRRCQPDFP